jgi:hypothetical protein
MILSEHIQSYSNILSDHAGIFDGFYSLIYRPGNLNAVYSCISCSFAPSLVVPRHLLPVPISSSGNPRKPIYLLQLTLTLDQLLSLI